jgi:hypothetical protein
MSTDPDIDTDKIGDDVLALLFLSEGAAIAAVDPLRDAGHNMFLRANGDASEDLCQL